MTATPAASAAASAQTASSPAESSPGATAASDPVQDRGDTDAAGITASSTNIDGLTDGLTEADLTFEGDEDHLHVPLSKLAVIHLESVAAQYSTRVQYWTRDDHLHRLFRWTRRGSGRGATRRHIQQLRPTAATVGDNSAGPARD